MKKILIKVAIAFACVCITIFFGGCNKLFDGSGHYTLSGTLIDSCGGQRVPGRNLVVIYSQMTYPHPVTNKVIGRGQADASGYFQIRCEHVNSGDIALIDTVTGYKYFQIASPLPSDSIYPLGFVYTAHGTYKAIVNIKVTGTFSLTDTLYIGSPGQYYKYYYPVVSPSIYHDIFYKNAQNGIYKQVLSVLRWEVGFSAFMKTYNELPVAFNICDYPDTTTSVTINRP
jgi:hypothetical protein